MTWRNDDLWLEVDLAALRHNYRQVRDCVGGTKGVIAVVKANAYGHGLVEVARALAEEDVPMLAVSHLAEGVILREAGLALPILLMVPSLPQYYGEIVDHQLTPTVDRRDNLALLAATGREVAFHLKINTGMNRFGLDEVELPAFLGELSRHDNLRLGGVFSHLASAMRNDDAATDRQIARFERAFNQCRAELGDGIVAHLCNSAGALSKPAARYDYVRVGTLLYGQYPATSFKGQLDLRDTWQAKTRLIETRSLARGEAVGYGGDYVCRRATTVGILPIGYTDGFGTVPPLNNITGKTVLRQSAKLFRNFLLGRANHCVYYRGKSRPVLGRIAMQTTVVDLGDSGGEVGDEVVVPLRRTAVSPSIKIIYHHGRE